MRRPPCRWHVVARREPARQNDRVPGVRSPARLPLLVALAWTFVGAGAGWLRAEPAVVTGIVVDSANAPIAGATISIEIETAEPLVVGTTGPDGRFTIPVTAGRLLLTIRAPGFAQSTSPVTLPPAGPASPLTVVLHPAPIVDAVTVTGTHADARLGTPAAVSVVSGAELVSSPAGALDDALRNTPGFSLFRRSSSRVANPTTQGVTLRGVSGSGASRTLVLADGRPLNDPFGSWVYWSAIPVAAIERVEVVRGAAGDQHGADALGGVVQVLTYDGSSTRVRAALDAGSHGTRRASLFAGGGRGAVRGTMAAEALATDGVTTVAAAERGAVDTRADDDYRSALASLAYHAAGGYVRGHGSVFHEDRGNGTPLQLNGTTWRRFGADAGGSVAGGAWTLGAWGGTQRYAQTFSAVAATRATERLTTTQSIPSSVGAASAQWLRSWGTRSLLAGSEVRRVAARVDETRYSLAGVASGPFVTGGTESTGAAYVRAAVPVGRVVFGPGVRLDAWRSRARDASLGTTRHVFASPRLAVGWQASPAIALRASVAHAFRTPTLNELHRGFRQGNVVTNANARLAPERLTAIEAGLLWSRPRTTARLTAYWNQLDDAIANVTVRTTSSEITRERQNTDTVRAAGLEAEVDLRVATRLRVGLVGVVGRSVFARTPAQPALEGRRVPQTARHQLGVNARWADPRVATVTAQLRLLGRQFDDDQNLLPLDAFTVLDVSVTRTVARGVSVFAAVENLFDTEYQTGRSPVVSVGWPRTVSAGLRVFLP